MTGTVRTVVIGGGIMGFRHSITLQTWVGLIRFCWKNQILHMALLGMQQVSVRISHTTRRLCRCGPTAFVSIDPSLSRIRE